MIFFPQIHLLYQELFSLRCAFLVMGHMATLGHTWHISTLPLWLSEWAEFWTSMLWGLQVCFKVAEHPKSPNIPVIIYFCLDFLCASSPLLWLPLFLPTAADSISLCLVWVDSTWNPAPLFWYLSPGTAHRPVPLFFFLDAIASLAPNPVSRLVRHMCIFGKCNFG